MIFPRMVDYCSIENEDVEISVDSSKEQVFFLSLFSLPFFCFRSAVTFYLNSMKL